MSGYDWAPLAWTILSLASWPYAGRVRHPTMSHPTAWLILVATASAVGLILIGLLTAVATELHRDVLLSRPLGLIALLILASTPGLLLGRWLILRPLRRMPLPGE